MRPQKSFSPAASTKTETAFNDTEYRDKRQHYSQERLRHGSKPLRKRYRKLQSNLEAQPRREQCRTYIIPTSKAIATHNAYT